MVIDLATQRRKGDKRSTPFFAEPLPRGCERRARSPVNSVVNLPMPTEGFGRHFGRRMHHLACAVIAGDVDGVPPTPV